MKRYLVGRQPIFDASLRAHAYELLFRGPASLAHDGDAMTADVLVCAGMDVGLDRVVGTKQAFVNATRSFLVGEQSVPLSPAQVVIEVLEDVGRDSEVVMGCQRLVDNGFALALDDYVWPEGDDPLLEIASYVKLDVLALDRAQLERAVHRSRRLGLTLVAEKVETQEQFVACQQLGFHLYQGYLLSHPEVVEVQALSPSKLTCLNLLQKVCDPLTPARDIARIVQTDAAMSYRFLRAAGAGAAAGLYRRVRSVHEAVVLLGQSALRSWVMLMLLDDGQEGSDEQLMIALVRARMAELLVMGTDPEIADKAFTVGLLSALDLVLQAPLQQLLANMSLAAELEDALVGRGGVLGAVLADVLAWELGGVNFTSRSGHGAEEVAECYLGAVSWANDVFGVLKVVPD